MKLTNKDIQELERITTIAIWGEIIHVDKRERGNAATVAKHIVPYIAEFFERDEQFYTIEQIADNLQLDLQTVTKYVREGDLKAIALGKGYRIPKSDFDEFVKQRSTSQIGQFAK